VISLATPGTKPTPFSASTVVALARRDRFRAMNRL
jgi:hypothetical protein